MNETQRRRALADVKEFFLRAGALAALLLVLFGVVFGLAIQPDDTMYPHLKPGDLLLFKASNGMRLERVLQMFLKPEEA